MSRLTARITPMLMIVLIILVGESSQSVWANEDPSPVEMMRECSAGRDMDCFHTCRRARRPHEVENCRAAYNRFKTGQSAPTTTGAEAVAEEMPSAAAMPGEKSVQAGVDQVTVMGVRLCSDVVQAGVYLEGRGYKNAAMFANSMRKISVSRREGNNNYDFKINYGGPRKRDAIYLMSFHGSFPDGPNLFEVEKSKFEEATDIELTCNSLRRGPKDTRLECTYPAGEADRSQPGFSYSIAHEEGQKAFFVDAAAWGYEDCGP